MYIRSRSKSISGEEQISNEEYMWSIIFDDLENLSDVQKNIRRVEDYYGKMRNLYTKGDLGTEQEKLYNDYSKNIGHKKYFYEFNFDNYDVVIKSLKAIGAVEYANLLDDIARIFVKTKNKNNIDLNKTLEVLEDLFIDFDKKFDVVNIKLDEYIEKYLNINIEDMEAYLFEK
jgi:hypothetical protein